MSDEHKKEWIKKIVTRIMGSNDFLRDKKLAGLIIQDLRVRLHLKQYQSGMTVCKMSMLEHGRLSFDENQLKKILSNFFDEAEKIHNEIENILWPIEGESK
jgi:hypothetical protein